MRLLLVSAPYLLFIWRSFHTHAFFPHHLDTMTRSSAHSDSILHARDSSLPTMIVFDLDDCLWSPEMYTLYDTPSIPIEGPLNPDHDQMYEKGVIGMGVPPKGQPIVKLFPDARRVLRTLLLDQKYQNILIAAASSSEEPKFSYSCLKGIEITPGKKMIDMFHYHEIGRTGHLTSRKTTHFKALHEKSGVPFNEMLFFDDCNWGDHCADVSATFGVVSQRTPHGLKLSEFQMALDKFKKSVEQRSMHS